MDWSVLQNWLSLTPLWIVASVLFVTICLAALTGAALRTQRDRRVSALETQAEAGQEGYVVSAVLGLLALLLGFTFSLAVDRFDARRLLVLEEANAIGTAYLRSQLLPEPHRSRMSGLLIRYTDNRLALGEAKPDGVPPLLVKNDALVTDIWAAAAAAFDSIKSLNFSSAYVQSINSVIDVGSARKAARQARVPPEVFAALLVYMVVAAGVLGYVVRGVALRVAGGLLLALLTLSLSLIIDIDRPSMGGVVESQTPMEDLVKSLEAQPPAVFDKWR